MLQPQQPFIFPCPRPGFDQLVDEFSVFFRQLRRYGIPNSGNTRNVFTRSVFGKIQRICRQNRFLNLLDLLYAAFVEHSSNCRRHPSANLIATVCLCDTSHDDLRQRRDLRQVLQIFVHPRRIGTQKLPECNRIHFQEFHFTYRKRISLRKRYAQERSCRKNMIFGSLLAEIL